MTVICTIVFVVGIALQMSFVLYGMVFHSTVLYCMVHCDCLNICALELLLLTYFLRL